MKRFIVRRILTSVVVIFGISIVAFLLPRLSGGDPVLILMAENSTPAQMDQARAFWGLDKPLVAQYLTFVEKAVTGDMGTSIVTGRSTMSMIAVAFPNTLLLALCAWIWAVAVGVPLGILAALYRNRLADFLIRSGSLIGRGVPHFWLAIMAILVFAVTFHVFPAEGLGFGAGGRFRHLVLPSLVLGSGTVSLIVRMVRSEMLEVLGQDYVRAARSKGLPGPVVILRHALRNSLIPVVTVMGLEFGSLMGGAIVTETIFAYPGLGRLAVQSIFGQDYPMIQALVLVFATAFVVINFLVDVAYAYLDPRIRYA